MSYYCNDKSLWETVLKRKHRTSSSIFVRLHCCSSSRFYRMSGVLFEAELSNSQPNPEWDSIATAMSFHLVASPLFNPIMKLIIGLNKPLISLLYPSQEKVLRIVVEEFRAEIELFDLATSSRKKSHMQIFWKLNLPVFFCTTCTTFWFNNFYVLVLPIFKKKPTFPALFCWTCFVYHA